MSDGAMFLDLDDIKGIEPLPEGNYEATVIEANPKRALSGNWMSVLIFGIDDPNYDERKIYYNLVLSPKSMWKVKQDLETLGCWDSTYTGQMAPEDLAQKISDDVLGKRAILTLIEDEYNGKPKNTVKALSPI